jgi:plasmid stability protein
MRAAENGHSMEEEARRIPCAALDREPPRTLADLAMALFGPGHGIELGCIKPTRVRTVS